MSPTWDERYAGDDYAFGTEPNDFLRDHACAIPRGAILCIGEGEGRNATFLATQGHPIRAHSVEDAVTRDATAPAAV